MIQNFRTVCSYDQGLIDDYRTIKPYDPEDGQVSDAIVEWCIELEARDDRCKSILMYATKVTFEGEDVEFEILSEDAYPSHNIMPYVTIEDNGINVAFE